MHKSAEGCNYDNSADNYTVLQIDSITSTALKGQVKRFDKCPAGVQQQKNFTLHSICGELIFKVLNMFNLHQFYDMLKIL